MKFKNDPRALIIGNFDGVHRGHQALINKALELSPHVVVLTFAPHPRLVFQPDTTSFLITDTPRKNALLRQFGATEVITWPFSKELAAVPAEIFWQEVIVKQTQPNFIIVGDDFHFGKDREGNIELLRNGQLKGRYQLHVVEEVKDHAEKISSTAIRKHLTAGDIETANTELGWEYCIEAEVIPGDKRGREIGFPTANQRVPQHVLLPSYGIYASYVEIDGVRHMACTSIGIRPMFEVQTPIVETHILDWNGDLYGKTLRVTPIKKLRNEEKYDSLKALTDQIAKDCNEARALLVSQV